MWASQVGREVPSVKGCGREGLGSVPEGRGGGRSVAEFWFSEGGRARGLCRPPSLSLISH